MNTTHVEHDALAALRAELTMAAGRHSRKRRTRRRAVVIVAVIALLLAATAATAALIKSGTGVPAVDRLLEIDVPPSRRPATGSASKPLKIPEGDHRTNVVAYLARDGSVCVSSADFGGRGGSVRGGFGGCPPLQDVNRRVGRRGAVWFGSAHGPDQRTYQLIVSGGVKEIRPLGPGDWRVLMTPSWTPRASGARPLRLAVAIDDEDVDVGGDGLQPDEFRLLERHLPRLELVYRDGRTRVAKFP
jgi:hypothetical protein